mgnify:CR=1 FL=1
MADIDKIEAKEETLREDLSEAIDELEENKKITFLDTPGHAAFTNLRKRGGSLADIAICRLEKYRIKFGNNLSTLLKKYLISNLLSGK